MKEIHFDELTIQEAKGMVGPNDSYLGLITSELQGEIHFRKDHFLIDGKQRDEIEKVLQQLFQWVRSGKEISERDISYLVREIKGNPDQDQSILYQKIIGKTHGGKTISPKTQGQFHFVEAMEKKDIVFSVGPAGTGKTYLAVVRAASLLKDGKIKRIVLTRPAVEAGENLGFLPGDLKEKVDPYLTPLYDALYNLFGSVQTEKYIEKGIVEIAPLAYMRGRTLDDAFVILDEAQNTTAAQMKMFLTRLGFNSKMVITGDVTQIDLVKNQVSGLLDATKVLKPIPEIEIVHLSSKDVVRHPLVQKIIDCYEKVK